MNKTLAFILLSLLMAATSVAIDLDSLFVQSVGGPAAVDSLRRMTSFQAERSVILNGMPGRFVEYFVPPDRFYTELEFGPVTVVQAYDGRIAWQKDMNGQVSRLEGFERDEILKGLYFNSFSYLFPDRFEGSFGYQGELTKDGQRYHAVAFVPLQMDTVLGYFDVESGQLTLSTSFADELPIHTFRRKFEEFGGLRWPTVLEVVAEGAPASMQIEYEAITLNEPIEHSIFTLPTAKSTDFGFPDGVDSVVVRFVYRAGHIRLPVIINGTVRAWMILDSGASNNILNKSLADRFDLEVVGKMAAKGIGAYEEVEMVQLDSIRISSLVLRDQVAGSLDLSTISPSGSDGDPFGGLLGYDFLSRFPILVDYRDSTLTVYNPETFEPADGGAEVDFFLTMKVPTVRGELNGLPGDFIVDLGNVFGLVVHNSFAEAHNLDMLLDHVDTIPRSIGGVGGIISGRTAYVASFRMGDVLIQSLRVLMPDSGHGLAGSEELAGNIGNRVLEKFNILLDYAGSRLIFYPTDRMDMESGESNDAE